MGLRFPDDYTAAAQHITSRPPPIHSPEPNKGTLVPLPLYGCRHQSLSAEVEVEMDKVMLLPAQVLQRNMAEGALRLAGKGVRALE